MSHNGDTLGHGDGQWPLAMVQLKGGWPSIRTREGMPLGFHFGSHGEASKEVHDIIDALAATRLKTQDMAIGH